MARRFATRRFGAIRANRFARTDPQKNPYNFITRERFARIASACDSLFLAPPGARFTKKGVQFGNPDSETICENQTIRGNVPLRIDSRESGHLGCGSLTQEHRVLKTGPHLQSDCLSLPPPALYFSTVLASAWGAELLTPSCPLLRLGPHKSFLLPRPLSSSLTLCLPSSTLRRPCYPYFQDVHFLLQDSRTLELIFRPRQD